MDEQPTNSLWRNRDFVLLWSGQAVSTLGTRFSGLALPLLVLAVTHSPAQAGLIGALSFLPYLVFGLLVDRWDRKRTMALCDLARCVAFGSVPLAVALGHLMLPQLYLVAFVDGTSFVLFNAAQVAALPQVVRRGRLPRATAWNETAGTAATLVGPGLSGAIIGLARTTIIGAALAYLLDSLSYLVSALALTLIRTPFQATPDGEAGNAAARRSLRAEIGEGVRFLWGHPQLRLIALLSTAITLCESPLYLAIILLARRELQAGPPTIGLIVSVAGLGGLAGALLAPRLVRRLRIGRTLIGLVAVKALALPLVALATSPAMLALGAAIVVATGPVYNVTQLPYRLALIPDQLQGRVNSVFRLLSYGGVSLGTGVGGLLLGSIGARVECWLMAGGLGLAALSASATALRRI
jgi:MFS family permease